MHAIRVTTPGGPETLEFVEIETPRPRDGAVLVRQEAVGVNYIDVYHRTGQYKLELPFTPGSEGAGVVEETGERVAYAMVPGAYAEYALVPAEKLVPVPDGITTRDAAAAMLQGMTAHYLACSTYAIQRGDAVLVHAAAGGVGGLLVQIAKLRSARVIATVSTEEKAAIARAAGADDVILYTQTDFEAEVLRLTNGEGVAAVYDGVGRSTFDKSLNCVGRRGVLALYGAASGPVPPVDPGRLAKKAIFLTRPGLAHYTATREELLARARDVFTWLAEGKLTLHIDRELPLRDAAEAHRLLESRATTGKLLLIP